MSLTYYEFAKHSFVESDWDKIKSDKLHFKKNWHAKKLAGKIRDLKKTSHVPQKLRDEIYNFTRNYECKTIKTNYLYTVINSKKRQEIFGKADCGNVKKSKSLKAVKNQLGYGNYSQQYFSHQREYNSYDYNIPPVEDMRYHYSLFETKHITTISTKHKSYEFESVNEVIPDGKYTKEQLLQYIENPSNEFIEKLDDLNIKYGHYYEDLKAGDEHIDSKYVSVKRWYNTERKRFCSCEFCNPKPKSKVKRHKDKLKMKQLVTDYNSENYS